MDLDRVLAFSRTHHRAVLSTLRNDGKPQLSPVLVAVDAEGRAIISTRETAMKTRNLRRRPEAFLCVFTDTFFGPWVQAEGTAEILSLPEALEPLVDYYRLTAGEHENWDEYRQAMWAEQRCLIRVTIERTGPNVSG